MTVTESRFAGLAAVHGLVGVYDARDGVGHSSVERLRRIGDGPIDELGALALASRGLSGSTRWSDGRWTCVLDGRLHDRDEIVAALGLALDAPGPQIVASAVARWGGRAGARLRGSYAYITWDAIERRGWLGQDHLGARSLYLLQESGRWIFGSELRLVLEVAARRPAPDEQGVIEWLGGRRMSEGRMLHAGVRRLGGARFAALAEGDVQTQRYWKPRFQGELQVTRDEAADVLRDAVRTAIRRCVRRGEHVGTLLSGGIDSTVIAAGLARWCRDLTLRATAYSMFIPDDLEDESRYIDIATTELRMPGWRVIPTGDGALWHALRYQDAFALPLVTPGTVLDQHLVRQAAADGADAILDGQGGDEVFGHEMYLLADLARRGRVASVWRLLHASPEAGAEPAWWQMKSMLRTFVFRGNTPRWYDLARPDERQLAVPSYLRRDLAERHRDRIEPFPWKRASGPRWWAHLASMLTELPDVYWVPDVLRRRGRLEGIESRSPLLDVDLAETALRLPPRFAFDPVVDRALVRHAMRGIIPDPIRLRARKSNYAGANHRWLTRLVPAFEALLGAPDAEIGAYVDRAAVRRLLDAVPTAADPNLESWGPEIWTLASAELWLRAEAGRATEVQSIVQQTRQPSHIPVAAPWRPPASGS